MNNSSEFTVLNFHPLIFESGTMTCFENLFWGPAHIVEFPVREVTFERLSENIKPKALALGFSPPIHLPSRMPVEDNSYVSDWWILSGELIFPIIRIRSDNGKDFFELVTMNQ